ncbi:MAG: type III pantothenate kinase [Paludibacteraceae bacterium]|nr:type III pantothenate kinase [Paludibacteraceae bacterium]
MKRLTIDIGNTRTKTAVFSNGQIIQVNIFDSNPDTLNELLNNCLYDEAIVCQVSGQQLPSHSKRLHVLSHDTPLPISINYSTPRTLGLDRIAAAAGANDLYSGTNCLVIDAGTAITYDFVTAEGVFLGGNIAPGVAMRYVSLHEHTALLPKLDKTENELPPFGKTTESAMRCGVECGIAAEVAYWHKMAQNVMGKSMVIITGGDADTLAKRIENNIECQIQHHLVHYGLNAILRHTKQ